MALTSLPWMLVGALPSTARLSLRGCAAQRGVLATTLRRHAHQHAPASGEEAGVPAPVLVPVLHNRGLVHSETSADIGARLAWRLQAQGVDVGSGPPLSVYCGFDPTAPTLHVGNLVSIMLLAHAQRAGLRPIALIGGATARLGDPSGRSTERVAMSDEQIRCNVEGIRRCLTSVLGVDRPVHEARVGGPPLHAVKLVNNTAWYDTLSTIGFFEEVGQHFRMSTMLGKESVRSRLHSDAGMSFNEFAYQMLQGFDFCHLYERENCVLQVGGSDQWGNITSGTDLVRKKLGGDVFGITTPLLTTATGEKLGKSAGNAVWLDSDWTTPYSLYQYFLSTDDADLGRMMRILTFMPLPVVADVLEEHAKAPESRSGQKALAAEVTRFIHGEEGLVAAETASQVLFGASLKGLTLATLLEVFENVPSAALPYNEVVSSDVCTLAVAAGVTSSKGEARRMVKGGGLYLNNERVCSADQTVHPDDLLHGAVCTLRSGRKRHFLVRVDTGCEASKGCEGGD